MKQIGLFIIVSGSMTVLHAATVISGCVTDASGKPVAGARVFVQPEFGDKTYRAEVRKSDGCYEMRIGKDGTYRVGVRDLRFDADGPIQRRIMVPGGSPEKVDLSTDVPNGKLLGERLTDAVLSASDGFSRVRGGVRGGDVPTVMGQIPSGFGDCMLQSSNDQNGPTALWWCSTGGGFAGIRDERAAHAMFESIRDSIGTALGGLGQLRYSPMKLAGDLCGNCVDRAVWASPINGVIALSQTKVKKRNALVLWAAYNSPMTEEGCASIQKNEEPKVDVAKYDSTINAMRDEYARQVNAAIKAELRNLFGAAVGGPGFIGPSQQPGVADASVLSPNGCLSGSHKASVPALPRANSESQIKSEIESIESGGQVSPLPEPVVSDRLGHGFNVSRTLDNHTAYVLVVLLSGPTDKRIVVPPGTKQTFEIPAGRYKIAARLSAPDFPPFFAIQEYLSGHDYKSDFVVQ